jgi:hypothetical protein
VDVNTRIVEVDAENIAEHPQVVCFINPKHDTYYRKIDWLKSEFERGLRIKLLYVEGEKRAVGYVEYVPGEHCWRAVDARGYVFIHCIWTNGKKHQHLGLGGRLLQEVEKNAGDYEGVVALTSDGSFMASKELFVRHGYSLLEEKGKEQLMCKRFAAAGEEAHDDPTMHDSAGHYPAGYEPTGHDPAGGSGLPSFLDNSAILDDHRGLTIFYSKQCP